MKTVFKKIITSTRAAALVEYGMLVGLIAVLAIVAVTTLGREVESTFETVAGALSDNIGSEVQEDGGVQASPAPEPASITFVAEEFAGFYTGIEQSGSITTVTSYGTFVSEVVDPNYTIEVVSVVNSDNAFWFALDTADFNAIVNVPTGLTCDNGLTATFPPGNYINSAGGVWYANGGTSVGPDFVNGQTYTCTVTF